MPDNPELPESRAEATTARGLIKDAITEIPRKLGSWPLQNHVILLIMIIFAMGAGALYYQVRQISEMRAESAAIRLDNQGIRDRLTDYLVTANVSTTSALNQTTIALNQNTAALSENSRIMQRMEVVLDAVKDKLKN